LPQALAHLNAATQADPNYDRAYYELGVLYLRLNQVEEAGKAFQNVVRLNPDDYEAQGNLGVVCLKRNDLAGAERHFAAALRINPNDSIAQNYLNQIKAAMR
jgi:Flp pilus assembly protein TadD